MDNGVYILTNKSEEGFSAAINTVSIDQGRDFKIETCVTKAQGSGNNLFGLIWGHNILKSQKDQA